MNNNSYWMDMAMLKLHNLTSPRSWPTQKPRLTLDKRWRYGPGRQHCNNHQNTMSVFLRCEVWKFGSITKLFIYCFTNANPQVIILLIKANARKHCKTTKLTDYFTFDGWNNPRQIPTLTDMAFCVMRFGLSCRIFQSRHVNYQLKCNGVLFRKHLEGSSKAMELLERLCLSSVEGFPIKSEYDKLSAEPLQAKIK